MLPTNSENSSIVGYKRKSVEGGADSKLSTRNIRLTKPAQILDIEGNTIDNEIDIDESLLLDDLKCPICLGLLQKTWTVMACLHRFCSDCLHKSLRADLGPNKSHHECPACRIKLASRRSSNPDPYFDGIIKLFSSSYDDNSTSIYSSNANASMSTQEVESYKKIHEQNVTNFKIRQNELKSHNDYLVRLNENSSMSSSTRNNRTESEERNSEGQISLVSFSLMPWIDNENEQITFPTILKKPYLTTSCEMKVADIKDYLVEVKPSITKGQFSTLNFTSKDVDIGIRQKKKVISLQDSVSLMEICVHFWNRSSPLELSYRWRSEVRPIQI